MGNIEAKVREHYAIKQRPLFRRQCQAGIEPVNAYLYRSITGTVLHVSVPTHKGS